MPDDIRNLRFEGMLQPVQLCGCNKLISRLPAVFPGWKIEAADADECQPVLSLSRAGKKYSLEGYWIDEPLLRNDEVDAICALVAEVMRAYVRQDDRFLCLHAAAAEFDGRLVVFPSRYRAGKSILSACLAAAGTRLFCDDILPLSLHDGTGIAPGLAVRLRRQLPENLRVESRIFIESRTRLRGANYLYLDLGAEAMAPRDEQLPIGAIVLLERESGVSAAFEAISEAEVLAQMVWQNFAREAEAPAILGLLSRLVAGAKRFRLRYDRAEDAAALLQREFAGWTDNPSAPEGRSRLTRSTAPVADSLPAGHYRQYPGFSIVEVDGHCFVADRQGAAIHRLNPTGSAIWELLAEPMTPEEIVGLLTSAFPGLERQQVVDDVASLLGDLKAKNMLQFGG